MTYVNKKNRVFMVRDDLKPERRRSEGRLKTYPSAEDIRAWCDEVEDRRQHILELVTKGYDACTKRLISLSDLDRLMGGKYGGAGDMKKCLTQLWDFIDQSELSEADKKKLEALKAHMDKACFGESDGDPGARGKDLDADEDAKKDVEDLAAAAAKDAKERHAAFDDDENAKLRKETSGKDGGHILGTYKVRTGPGKQVTKIKGIQPGFKLPANKVVTRPQVPAKTSQIVKEVYPSKHGMDSQSRSQKSLGESGQPATTPQSSQVVRDVYPQARMEKRLSGETPSKITDKPSVKSAGEPELAKTTPTKSSQMSRREYPEKYDAEKVVEKPSSKAVSTGASEVASAKTSQMSRKDTAEVGKPSLKSLKDKGTSGMSSAKPSQMSNRDYDTEDTAEKPSAKSLGQSDIVGATSLIKSSQISSKDYPEEKFEEKQSSGTPGITSAKPSQISGKELSEKSVPMKPSSGISAKPSQMSEQVAKPSSKSLGDAETPRTSAKPSVISEKGSSKPQELSGDLQDEILKLQGRLAERDALCNEQQQNIDNLTNERDKLKNRIEGCLKELDNLKNASNADNPLSAASCKEEIETLEHEIKVMRRGNLSPEEEAELIKKEVEVLRKYCMKLKAVEDENERLKKGRDDIQPSAIPSAGDTGKLNEIIRERDDLANKVQKLEQELSQYRDLDVYKNKTQMLDNTLAERDDLSKQLEKMKSMEREMDELRRKASKADQLERDAAKNYRNELSTDMELKRTQSKCICLEKELNNVKREKDAMNKRIGCMCAEIDVLRPKAREAEMAKLERDKMQIKLNELSHVQVHNENLMLKCKCLENAAMERDTYKQKYEDIITTECQCEALKAQAEDNKFILRERDALKKQVQDLEACIREQEDEIKRLMAQIDGLMRSKDDTQGRMKDALANMRAEVEKKDNLIAASEEKLANVQAQLKSSIQGVSCETSCYKTRIEELERELSRAQCKINCLEMEMNERDGRNQLDSIAAMKRELDTAREENRKLQDIAKKMVKLTGDEHVQKMLKQSECAVKRVVEELSRQYREWDNMKQRNQKGKFALKEFKCPCNNAGVSRQSIDMSDSDSNSNAKVKEDYEIILREKEKLENLVRELQTEKYGRGCQKQIAVLRGENEKLQEALRKEADKCRKLEKKLNR